VKVPASRRLLCVCGTINPDISCPLGCEAEQPRILLASEKGGLELLAPFFASDRGQDNYREKNNAFD
jgi:hypothetical protein